jgi:hypothetical protein
LAHWLSLVNAITIADQVREAEVALVEAHDYNPCAGSVRLSEQQDDAVGVYQDDEQPPLDCENPDDPLAQLTLKDLFAQVSETKHSCTYAHERIMNNTEIDSSKYLDRKGEKFVDSTFPVEEAILWKDFDAGRSRNLNYLQFYFDFGYFKWYTLEEAGWTQENGYSLWGHNGVTPSDITQGSIGNCWFMAGLAAIAEKSERLQNIFQVEELNDASYYPIKMYPLGVPATITIDDKLPVY